MQEVTTTGIDVYVLLHPRCQVSLLCNGHLAHQLGILLIKKKHYGQGYHPGSVRIAQLHLTEENDPCIDSTK